jgi:protein SCO1/2
LLSTVKRQDYASVPKKAASRPGEDLFITRCAICHTIGEGRSAGPDLLGVVGVRDLKWLIRWLMEPDVMLKEKDPLATALFEQYNELPMPNLKLSEQDAIDLIYFMQVESKQAMEKKAVSNVTQHDHSAHQHPDPGEPEPKHDDQGDHQHQ